MKIPAKSSDERIPALRSKSEEHSANRRSLLNVALATAVAVTGATGTNHGLRSALPP
ncbi:hypothetical protein OKW43_005747 [Paraburkholderia sp. WC7.3g]